MTLPIVADGFQQQMGYSNSSFVGVLFFVSTLGAVLEQRSPVSFLCPWVSSPIPRRRFSGKTGVPGWP